MPDTYDRYREALVAETKTIWPPEFDSLDAARKSRLAAALHADPQPCANLEYVRVHTGFCRQITVTSQDVERLGAQVSAGTP
jgi:hypothetical protein